MTKPRTFSATVCAGVLVLLFGATVRDTLAQGVVITGRAEATEKRNLPFGVARVDASQLNQVPAVSALGSLEGKVAGVRVIQGSGAPGSDPVIRLRGATAITSPSSCNTQPCPSTAVPGPLIVVDGTITHYSLADISPQEDRKSVV